MVINYLEYSFQHNYLQAYILCITIFVVFISAIIISLEKKKSRKQAKVMFTVAYNIITCDCVNLINIYSYYCTNYCVIC